MATTVDATWFKHHEILPEQDLALAVLEQAIEDLRYVGMPERKKYPGKGLKVHVGILARQARAFLNSQDCAYWCGLAGVEVDYVVSLARRKYPQAFQKSS